MKTSRRWHQMLKDLFKGKCYPQKLKREEWQSLVVLSFLRSGMMALV